MSKQWTPKVTNAARPDNSLNVPARNEARVLEGRQRMARRARYAQAVQRGQIASVPQEPQGWMRG